MVGIKWRNKVYVNAMLSFGFRSVLKIVTALADALEWCIAVQGVEHVTTHCLDDFVAIDLPHSEICARER